MSDFKIIPYAAEYRQAFYDLNVEWLKTYFYVEDIDEIVLSDPEKHILSKGGHIVMAIKDGEAVGTCALKKQSDKRFELTKLAVTPRVQGGGMGRALTVAIIDIYKNLDGRKLYLETNSALETAIQLYKQLNFVEMENPIPTIYERANYYMEWMG